MATISLARAELGVLRFSELGRPLVQMLDVERLHARVEVALLFLA
jgi:hypothetical protein